YRIRGLAKGHYYVAVQCADAIPVAHLAANSAAHSAAHSAAPPAIQRGSDGEAPKQKYAMEFYPDSPEFASAARLMIEAGASVSGIDFRLRPTSTITVRGRLTGDPDALRRNLRVMLEPRDAALTSLLHYPATVD